MGDGTGDPTRRAIFEHLADRPRFVGDAGELPVSRPAVSQHLKVLKEAGLVVDAPVGTCRIYQLDPRCRRAARLSRPPWDQASGGYKRAVEQQAKESS